MVAMRILLIIDDGIYVRICTVYSSVSKEVTQHAFDCDSYFSIKKMSEWCIAIIYNRSYAPISVLEAKERKRKDALKNMIRIFFGGNFIVEFAFKFNANDSS